MLIDFVWFGLAYLFWFDLVWFTLVWFDLVWVGDVVWFGLICGLIWCVVRFDLLFGLWFLCVLIRGLVCGLVLVCGSVWFSFFY